MADSPLISIVLGSYNRLPYLRLAMESVRSQTLDLLHEIIVVDGGSTDGSTSWLAKQKDVISIIQHNRGTWRGRPLVRRSWGYFMNLGFKCAQGKFVLMISDDCILVPGAIQKGVRFFEHALDQGRKVGAVAFYWRNWPLESAYRVGTTFGGRMFVNHGLYLRQALQEVGWIEEDRYLFYYADGDLGLKLWQAGYTIADCPDAYVEHYAHANFRVRGSNLTREREDWQAYLQRWGGILGDSAKGDTGGWRYRPYHDPSDTVARFPKWPILRSRVSAGLRRLVRRGGQKP